MIECLVPAAFMLNRKSALGELRDVALLDDHGERMRALARWESRWVEAGAIDSDVDERIVAGSLATGLRVRSSEDAAAVGALAREVASRFTVMLEDQGVQPAEDNEGKKYFAYRTRITMTALRAMPRE